MQSNVVKGVLGFVMSVVTLPAVAEVSAQDVWSDWKTMFETISDGEIVAIEQVSGNTLVVSGLAFGMSSEDAGYSFSTDELRFAENGDGTVTVMMAPEMSISLRADVEEFAGSDLNMIIRQTGLTMLASGEPQNVSYDYRADAINTDFSAEVGDEDDLGQIVYAVAMSGISGSYVSETGEGYASKGETRADVMEIISEIGQVEGEVIQSTRSTVNDLVSWYDVSVPDNFSLENPQALLDGMVSFEAGYRSSGQTMEMQMIQDGMNLVVNGTSGQSSSDLIFNDSGIGIKGDVKDSTYVVQAIGMPFPPVEITLADAAADIHFPLFAKTDPQEYRMMMRLSDLAVSDDLWGMIDPTGGIPRVPSTIVFDLEGQMDLLADLVNPDAFDEGEDWPLLIRNLNVNEIQLAVAGAKLLADGGFVFDNENLDTFDGIPAPEGRLNVSVSGAMTLMDTLVQLGLVPQDQAMGAQMMMSLFMRPDGGEDNWVTEIEVLKDGSVYANGQQLQ